MEDSRGTTCRVMAGHRYTRHWLDRLAVLLLREGPLFPVDL